MTLMELKEIKKTLDKLDLFPDQRINIERGILKIIQREIDLKEIDMVTGKRIQHDVNGNMMDED